MGKQISTHVLIFVFLVQTVAFAKSAPPALPVPPPLPGPSSVEVTPDSLRTIVLSQNISIIEEQNQVAQAKESLNVARAKALPSLNLGVAISGGFSFGLSIVQFLLPFLLPSTWLNIKANKDLLVAEGVSYHVMQLNIYASAESMYLAMLNDTSLLNAIQKQVTISKQLATVVNQNYMHGFESKANVDAANAQAENNQYQFAKTQELLTAEAAALRKAMGLPLTTTITLDAYTVPASEFEGKAPADLIEQALAKAPEFDQLNFLYQAAKAKQAAGAWSWLSGFSFGSSGQNSGFGNLVPGVGLNLGFGIFPQYKLDGLTADQVLNKETEARQTEQQALETTLNSIESAKVALQVASQALVDQQSNYNQLLATYKMGLVDYKTVLQAYTPITQNIINSLNAQIDLDTLRVNLHRIMLTDQFAQIHDCKLVDTLKNQPDLLNKLFGAGNLTLEQACQQTPTKP